jgi:hypothetical protein
MKVGVPHIRDVENRVAHAHELLDYLLKEYRWAANAAWANPRRGGERVRGPGHSDPTTSAAAMGSLRHGCRLAAQKLEDAIGMLSSGLGILEQRMDRQDPPRTIEPIGPRLAGPSDLAEARGAKARRGARGEGWGDA